MAVGATVIILAAEGAEALLGKARCSRAEVLDWFRDPANLRPERFMSLWEDFVSLRARSHRHPCQGVESTYSDTGFLFPVPSRKGDAGPCAEDLLREAERRLALEDREDGLLDRYGDQVILVDLRQFVPAPRHGDRMVPIPAPGREGASISA